MKFSLCMHSKPQSFSPVLLWLFDHFKHFPTKSAWSFFSGWFCPNRVIQVIWSKFPLSFFIFLIAITPAESQNSAISCSPCHKARLRFPKKDASNVCEMIIWSHEAFFCSISTLYSESNKKLFKPVIFFCPQRKQELDGKAELIMAMVWIKSYRFPFLD